MRHPIRCTLSPFTFVGVLSLTTGARAVEADGTAAPTPAPADTAANPSADASEDDTNERTYATHFSGADEDGPWPRVGLGGGVAAGYVDNGSPAPAWIAPTFEFDFGIQATSQFAAFARGEIGVLSTAHVSFAGVLEHRPLPRLAWGVGAGYEHVVTRDRDECGAECWTWDGFIVPVHVGVHLGHIAERGWEVARGALRLQLIGAPSLDLTRGSTGIRGSLGLSWQWM